MRKYKVVLYSKDAMITLVHKLSIEGQAERGTRIIVTGKNNKAIILQVERVHWIDIEPDCPYLTCSSLHPLKGPRDGEWQHVQFGGITRMGLKGLDLEQWNSLHGGPLASYLTAEVA